MPKESLLKQYCPTGVMIVVIRREVGERGISQNPLFASNLPKSLVPVSGAKVSSSTFGSVCTSLKTLMFRGFKSTHMCTAPVFFGTMAITANHPGTPLGRLLYFRYRSHLFHSVEFLYDLSPEGYGDMLRGEESMWDGINIQLYLVVFSKVA